MLVEGRLSTGPTPSSLFYIYTYIIISNMCKSVIKLDILCSINQIARIKQLKMSTTFLSVLRGKVMQFRTDFWVEVVVLYNKFVL